jgi:hypothetical protein
LKAEFPNTQFILTTHDRVWLHYMRAEGLIARSQTFAGWTVDLGPRVWDDRDIWVDLASELDKGDVPKAAWLLRHYLEHTAAILADNLRGGVEFRGDAQYDLGDLLPPALTAWKKRLEDAEKAAEHWGRNEEREKVREMRAAAKRLIATTNAEQWVINPSVHFNEWANFQPSELRAVIAAFKDLLGTLRCTTCKAYLYVVPRKGPAEEIKCNCGFHSINLRRRA